MHSQNKSLSNESTDAIRAKNHRPPWSAPNEISQRKLKNNPEDDVIFRLAVESVKVLDLRILR